MGRLEEILAGPAPPSYDAAVTSRSNTIGSSRMGAELWLRILEQSVDASLDPSEQALGWYYMHRNVRFVCKGLYLVCMHLMRSRFLNQYTVRVRYPCTTNPFPTGELPSVASASFTPDSTRNIRPPPMYSKIQTRDTKQSPNQAPEQTPLYASVNVSRRETRVLDLFIAAAVRTQMEKYDSELFMSSEGYAGISSDFGGEGTAGEGDTTTDLFALHQPRARLEDLVLAEAWQLRLVASSQAATTSQAQRLSTIRASSVAIDLRKRSAGLRLPAASSSYGALRTVLEVPRRADESLEDTAHAIVTAWRELG